MAAGAARRHPAALKTVLILASLIFYAAWDIRFLPLLLVSIVVNYYFGRSQQKQIRYLGIGFNLLLLGIFKYAHLGLPLPLGISFFTFQQIGYLADPLRKYNFWDYLLFVTFFPQLIAGPIVHHQEFIPQLKNFTKKISSTKVAAGIILFAVGLGMKVLIADALAPVVANTFDTDFRHFYYTLIGNLAFTLQIFFDFAGYSTMAIGMGKVFGLNLPENFDKPYLSTSVREFWRRWHITLGRFFRDYLYIPLGGSEHGKNKLFTYRNLIITFLLTGLWHGAGWQFVIWGGVHGLMIIIESAAKPFFNQMRNFFRWGVTITFVYLTWVLFRSNSLQTAGEMLDALTNLFQIKQTDVITAILSPWQLLIMVLGVLLVAILPKSTTLLTKFRPNLLTWFITFALLTASIINIFRSNGIIEFIYFEF